MNPAVSYLVRKLKTELKNHGGSGYHALQRKFRIMDDDNSKTINFGEFKKGISELGLQSLVASELRELFGHFDVNEDGNVDFEEFIRGVRDDLNPRRLQLVKEAFGRLDTDGSGVVDLDEIKLIYDVSKHPDFVAGKKTKPEILRVFMEAFEDSGRYDGKITIDEFINYYTNLGVSVDNDDYFELMIRNSWHMSGGEGSAANSSNKRVLVTHADGSQEVVEIKNDLGLAQGDTAGLLNRLSLQGVQASQVATSSGIDLMSSNNSKSKASAKQLLLARLTSEEKSNATNVFIPASPPKVAPTAGKRSTSQGAFASSLSNLLTTDTAAPLDLPKPPPVQSSMIFPSDSKAPGTSASLVKRSVEMPYGVKSLVLRMKTELKQHGAKGFHGLQRKFRIMDDDNSGNLNLGEFKKGLKELGLNLVDSEIRAIFDHFDFGNTGSIAFESFIQALRDDLSPRRLDIVKLAFSSLDSTGDGALDCSELLNKYDASKHPEVMKGTRTEEDVLREWVQVFEVGGAVDGKVTQEEFINYYHNLSASIDLDDYFELMVRNAWHLAGGEGVSASSANTRVLVTGTDGSQRVVEVKNDLGARTKDQLLQRVKKQDAYASTIDLFGGGNDGIDDTLSNTIQQVPRGKAGRKYVEPRLDAFKATIAPTGTTSVLAGVPAPAPLTLPPPPPTQKAIASGRNLGTPLSALAAASSRGVPEIIARVRAALAERGARGIFGLSRKFRIMDDNGDSCLSKSEFKKAMDECNIRLPVDELNALFKFFDNNNDSNVDYEEFLKGLRGPLNERRLAIIKLAYAKLDKDGNGIIDPADIMSTYDASQHPDVKKGIKTANEVLREFLDTFEVGGVIDGKVTYDEFANYYHNISMSVDNDDYFELMMRNAWRIVGGEGFAANTANKRVLVTNADGSQEVVTLINDTAQTKTAAQTLADVRAQAAKNANASSISFGDAVVEKNAPRPGSAAPALSAPRRGGQTQSSNSPFVNPQAPAPAASTVRRNYGHDNNKSSITLG